MFLEIFKEYIFKLIPSVKTVLWYKEKPYSTVSEDPDELIAL